MIDSSVQIITAQKIPELNMGVISAPDTLHKPVLFSHVKATQDFKTLDKDIYDGMKHSKPANRKHMPKSLFVIASVIAAAILGFKSKKLFKK